LKFLYVFFIVLVFFGCTPKNKVVPISTNIVDLNETIDDLVSIPQNISFYTKNIKINKTDNIQSDYEKRYFSIWNILAPTQSKEDIQWPFKVFNTKKNYAENLQLI